MTGARSPSISSTRCAQKSPKNTSHWSSRAAIQIPPIECTGISHHVRANGRVDATAVAADDAYLLANRLRICIGLNYSKTDETRPLPRKPVLLKTSKGTQRQLVAHPSHEQRPRNRPKEGEALYTIKGPPFTGKERRPGARRVKGLKPPARSLQKAAPREHVLDHNALVVLQ